MKYSPYNEKFNIINTKDPSSLQAVIYTSMFALLLAMVKSLEIGRVHVWAHMKVCFNIQLTWEVGIDNAIS
jgi:hypothetical protein